MAKQEVGSDELIEKWSFHWGIMDVLIGGKSSIDLGELRMKDWEEATCFLRYYGYDPDDPQDARQVHAIIIESWNFIERYLMPLEWRRGKRPPDDLLFADDARIVLLEASDARPENKVRQAWACALLRVMHTIAHIDGVFRLTDVEAAREQIMSRFRQFVFRDQKGKLRFGTPGNSVALRSVAWKLAKSRESIILKLLHKRANVAETIYDLLGIRIVTKELCDVMIVVKNLREHHMITFPNCNPSRARNTLLDVEEFKTNIDTLLKELEAGRITPKEFSALVKQSTVPFAKGEMEAANPHSGANYRSIQLTCRQRIRYPNPILGWLSKLERWHGEGRLDASTHKLFAELLQFSRHWGGELEMSHVSGFFPFEVQILDEKAASQNRHGDASHDRYKKSQVRAARRRVLQRVLSVAK